MSQYLKIKYNGSQEAYVPTKSVIDNLNIPNSSIYQNTQLLAPNNSYTVVSSSIRPLTNNSGSIGTLNFRFSNGYFNTLDISNSVIPTVDNTLYLGFNKKWKGIYVQQVQSNRNNSGVADNYNAELQLLGYVDATTANSSGKRTGVVSVSVRNATWENNANKFVYGACAFKLNDANQICFLSSGNNNGSIGLSNLRWGQGYFNTLNVSSSILPSGAVTIGETSNTFLAGHFGTLYTSIGVMPSNTSATLGYIDKNFSKAYINQLIRVAPSATDREFIINSACPTGQVNSYTTSITFQINEQDYSDGGSPYIGAYHYYMDDTGFYTDLNNTATLGNQNNNWNNIYTNGISNYVNTSSGTGTNYFDIIAGYTNDGGTLGYRNRSIRLITHQTMAGVTPYTNTLYVESYPAGPGIQVYPNDTVGTKNLGTTTSPWSCVYTSRINSNVSALGFENGYGTYTFKKDSEGNVLISPSTVGKALDSIILDSGECNASIYNWTRVILRMHYHGGSSYDINFQGYGPDFTPQFAPNKSGSIKLGNLANLWSEVYAKSGTIQTSDRTSKSHIHYIDESKPKIRSTNQEEIFTTNDIVEFIKQLNPATFVYKNADNEEQTIEEALEKSPASIQLGLIADDIKDTSLYKYIGVEEHFNKIIEEAEYDEEGNIIKEAIIKSTTALGLKPIPLATLALTACKYLLNINKQLESRIENLELKLS